MVVILDDGHVKLPRQQDKRHERQQRHCDERVDARFSTEDGCGRRPLHGFFEQRYRAVEHPKRHENPDSKECNQFDYQFGGHSQHQPVLMLGGVDMASTEQYREGCHRQGHEECNVSEQRASDLGA